MGAGPWLVEQTLGRPKAAAAWEIDQACIKITAHRLPWVEQRGDIHQDSPEHILEWINRHDPHQKCMVLWMAAPPCQDFSRVREDRPGHTGDRGGLFMHTVRLMQEVFKGTGNRPTGYIYENVVMAKADAKLISAELGAPVLACAGDFGWVTRPRLWWLSTDATKYYGTGDSQRPYTVSTQDGWNRLRLDEDRVAASDIDTDGWQFDEAVRSGRLRLPCATTPAADENGRPAPKGTRGKMTADVRARWLADRRRFAPWHYRKEAMLTDGQGRLQIPTPDIKEQLHHIPKGYTAVEGVDDRTRHRLIGNGWHWGVARKLLTLVVAATMTPTGANMEITTPPKQSTLQWVVGQLPPGGIIMQPRPDRDHGPLVPYDLDEEQHWRAALALPHPAGHRPNIEPGWEQVLELATRWRHDLPRIRREVIQDIRQMVEDGTDELDKWLAERPPQVRATFTTPDKPRPTQCLVLLQLLSAIDYPDVHGLRSDLSYGFTMMGKLRPGPGWDRRKDEKYSQPAAWDQFLHDNQQYVHRRVPTARASEHTDTLLKELIEEKRLGRVIGPCSRPPHWPRQTVALADVPGCDTLEPPPTGDIGVAASFPILQTDEKGDLKVRRGEDWRRSGHNSTVEAEDIPTHHFVDDFVQLARRTAEVDTDLQVYGHDLLNAYRQWPVEQPSVCGTFLPTSHGMTLWFHNAMCFGAAASVWNFNRAADALQQIIRSLLWMTTGHYVDDFNGVEPAVTATSAHEAFELLFELLGLRTKPSKAQPPATSHTIQGVQFTIAPTGVELAPTPHKIQKVLATIGTALTEDRLPPAEAQKLAGRLSFLTQAVFGAVGKAAIAPIYSRAAETAHHTTEELSAGLRTALWALQTILPAVRPRFVEHWPSSTDTAILFADAFFLAGEQRHKAGHVPTPVQARRHDRQQNG